jgi:D-sedoheptulose 7-phosphate isomerase
MTSVLSAQDVIHEHLKRSADIKLRTADACAADIERAAIMIADTFKAGGKLLICGNGGSAADSQHMAAEFVSRLTLDFERPGLPAIALTTDSSILTALANDFDFDGVFARQVQALGRPGDVLLAISTSGSSKNVLSAANEARRIRVHVIALIGETGKLEKLADVAIRIPSRITSYVQEAHLSVEHLLCYLVERHVCSGRY